MAPRDPTLGGSDPDRCWTRTNMSEATPDVLTPMCWSLWTNSGELCARRGWHDLGLIPRSMIRLPDDPNQLTLAPFFGWQALNVDRLATLMGALPGTSRADVERNMLGTARADPPPEPAPRGRAPIVAVRAPIVLTRQRSRVSAMYADQARWWRAEVLERPGAGFALLAESVRRFENAMGLHARARFLTAALHGAVTSLATGAGRPELAISLYAGFGDMAETGVAEDLWALSRNELTEQEFLGRHGYHGHQEGHITGVPWRVNPEPVRAMAAALVDRPERERPRLREQAAMARRLAAEDELRAALPRSRRGLVGPLGRIAGTQVRCMERTKAAFMMAFDGARRACELIGVELTGRGLLADPSDAAYLTTDELLGELPADPRELTAFRRARREHYRTLTLPTTFIGVPEPVVAADAESAATPVDPDGGDLVTGVAGSAGEMKGVARVLLELDACGELEPDEVLVCRYTDPSWVAAMSLASALVIDIGAAASHGAIVARELGIPCVIGTGTGTSRIRTGDLLHVDGTAGQVRILARS